MFDTMRRIIITFLILLVMNTYSMDIEPDSTIIYHFQDSIVVIANRYELSIKSIINTVDLVRVKKFPEIASHSVMQLVDMISSGTYVLDKKLIGYGVGSYGAGTINMRGMGGKPNSGVLVLINGRPDFMGIFGHPLPDVYGLESVEQIEVIKGPSSTIFGSNAMAGVVNLVSQPPSQNQIFIDAKAGNYNTYLQSVRGDLNLNTTAGRFIASHQETAGHIDSTEFDGWNLEARIDQDIGKNWKLSLEGKYVPYQFNDPFMGNDLANLGYYGKIRRGMADLQIAGNISRLKNSFHIYTNLGHHRFSDGFESHDFTYGFSSYQKLQYSDQLHLGFGLDAIHYGGKAKNVVNPQLPPDSKRHSINSLGFYAISFYNPHPLITLKGGIRYQTASLYTQKITPMLGLSFNPRYNTKIFVNYNQGFRIPTIQELYLFPPSNENLIPEKVESYEVGSMIYFLGKNHISLSYFNNKIINIIQQVLNPFPPPGQIYQNSGEASQWGFESTLNIRPFSYFQSRFSYSYINPDQLTALNPKHMFKYFLNFNLINANISLFGKYIADFYASNNKQDKLNDYNILNLSMSYPVGHFIFNLQLKNLFDSEYEVFPGYIAPKFNFLAGVTIKLFSKKP